MSSDQFWDERYHATTPTERSWTERDGGPSLHFIERFAPDVVPLVDVGGGVSLLTTELAARGWTDLTVLDFSRVALREAAAQAPDSIPFVQGDVRAWRPDRPMGLWHDRAVLHFCTDDADVAAYRDSLMAATAPNALAILGVFSPDGPSTCSGLPVRQWSASALRAWLGDDWLVLHEERRDHETPWESTQNFQWVVARRTSSSLG